ncbi:hypothetical protein UFOVP118_26 [uncultured Caudovirales phage]|uniref:Uncharacterized protein n=1 Tax=uncultured Caudovirales phage TaxID=2100421 RepID=A0A6J5L828_9CAUD|nr:hypothetical protein UFOVP118_26 [uncultured Caudovirales phage]
MKPHKWAKEIKAWADGAEIEMRTYELDEACSTWSEWKHWSKPTDVTVNFLTNEGIEYRIKPQPKEPQYLYVIMFDGNINQVRLSQYARLYENEFIFGKIKLEVDE